MDGENSVYVRRRGGAAIRSVVVLCAALALLVPGGPAAAQLGAGQLQKVHALTVNTAAWAVMRKLVATVARDAGLEKIANSPDAADTASVIFALGDSERRLDAVLAGAVRGGLTAQPVPVRPSATFAGLGLSRGRALGISCLIYGQSPENRENFAVLVGLSARDKTLCPRDYRVISRYWLTQGSALLRPANTGSDFSVKVQLDPAGGGAASARALLAAGQTLEQVANVANARLALRRDLTIRGTDCGDGQVAVSSEAGQIVLCYKLMADIADDVARGLTRQ